MVALTYTAEANRAVYERRSVIKFFARAPSCDRPVILTDNQRSAVAAVLASPENAVIEKVDTFDDMSLADKLRAELLPLLADSPLVQGTKVFKVQFPDRWAVWQRGALDDK